MWVSNRGKEETIDLKVFFCISIATMEQVPGSRFTSSSWRSASKHCAAAANDPSQSVSCGWMREKKGEVDRIGCDRFENCVQFYDVFVHKET